ncbi:uncharacterized protein KY384_008070 [Bacidia gigantensis]|uniref:uncharacterized protein n=1 Tax=Bacidia gigantensis TaxID=2732470 RepID=UPI001D0495BB|nr:uncharacterized protein KY384_008070 [Bacidia gigantensis]KAG8526641.1 hypothetical protein KY384_008070 [Bacidia gigantensis]
MHFPIIFGLSAALPLIVASPVQFPLPDGFPNPSADQVVAIQQKAGGSLPGGPLPASLQPNGVTALKLIALNEIFEVAYFTSLLYNITHEVAGYGPDVYKPVLKQFLVDTFTAVVNQEELHAVATNAALKNAGQTQIQPCKFQFPVTDFDAAIALAATFTDVVFATVPQAQAIFTADGGDESGLVPLFSSVIGQEGEQNGVYRSLQKKVPSSAPFLTGGAPDFAFTALQGFILPNSCPQPLSDIPLKTFGKLDVVSTPEAKNSTIEFAVPAGPSIDVSANAIVYLSGQNLPLTVPISDITYANGEAHFKAAFPFEAGFAKGLTIAALVKGTGNFKTAGEVVKVAVNGPGLIEVG